MAALALNDESMQTLCAAHSAQARRTRPAKVGGTDVSWVPASDNAIDDVLNRHAIRSALAPLSHEHRTVVVELYVAARNVRDEECLGARW